VQSEWLAFDGVNRWLQATVSEYRSSFRDGLGLALRPALQRFSYLVLLLPLWLWAIAGDRRLSAGLRVAVVGFGAGSFGLAAWEAKLGHLFEITHGLVLVLGARAIAQRWRAPTTGLQPLTWGFAALVLALAGLSYPQPQSQSTTAETGNLVLSDQALADACDRLRSAQANVPGTVLASWDHGAQIMYRAASPVVASGYHRNLAGIHDAYRLFLSGPGEEPEMWALLRQRQVRYVLIWFDRLWLSTAALVLDRPTPYVNAGPAGMEFTPAARESLFWRLRQGQPVAGFQEFATSNIQIRVRDGESLPLYRLYEVRWP
jgi:hypothetical protein